MHHCSIPPVLRRGVQFVLTAKTVNLFQGEGKVNAQRRAEMAQKRIQALERWLAEQHNLAVHR